MKPNTRLPKGAKLIKPFKRTIGNWVELEFDAAITLYGIRWLRVKGGFGDNDRHPREDWVADLEKCCLSVTLDNDSRKGYYEKTFTDSAPFEDAVLCELRQHNKHIKEDLRKAIAKAAALRRTITQLEKALIKCKHKPKDK